MGIPLSKIKVGQHAVIRSLHDSVLKVKMMEMGLIEGKKLTLLFKAPFGDPLAFDVEGYTLSLRLDEADLVDVELLNMEVS